MRKRLLMVGVATLVVVLWANNVFSAGVGIKGPSPDMFGVYEFDSSNDRQVMLNQAVTQHKLENNGFENIFTTTVFDSSTTNIESFVVEEMTSTSSVGNVTQTDIQGDNNQLSIDADQSLEQSSVNAETNRTNEGDASGSISIRGD